MVIFHLILAIFTDSMFSLPSFAHNFLVAALLCIFIAFQISANLKINDNKDKKILINQDLILKIYVLALFSFYVLLKNYNSFFYNVISKLSVEFSSLVGVFINKPVAMGITYNGFDLIILFFITIIVYTVLYKIISFKKMAIYTATILLIWAFYISFWTSFAESSIEMGLNLIEPITGPLDYRFVLFIFLSIFYACITTYKKHEILVNCQIALRTRRLYFACASLFVALIASMITPLLIQKQQITSDVKKILFWDSGIDFSVPEYGKYGLDNVGMFGILPHYLNKKGYMCDIVTEINKEQLNQSNVLVIFNPTFSPNEDTLNDIWAFVEEGGSVLAVGDHTGDEQIRFPINSILKPANISIQFDSAIPFKTLWHDSFKLMPDPIFKDIIDRQVQVVVGASLDIGLFAKPLIIGKNGYSDAGDYNNFKDGMLGDMHFSRGEKVGNLVLAAKASYGKGTFMAFGDTTTFQNTVISYSYSFIDNIFAELSSTKKVENILWEDDGFFKASCVIDFTHLEVISCDKSSDSIDGLISCAMRSGYLPYLNQTMPISDFLSTSDPVEMLILIEPTIEINKSDKEAVHAFMENGGEVVLCADYNSPSASKNFANKYNFSFDTMPIGRISPNQNADMAFWNACPILYKGETIKKENEYINNLIEIWDNCVIAHYPIKNGGLYVIADPDFLKNKNIEDADTFNEGNIMYIKELMKNAKKR